MGRQKKANVVGFEMFVVHPINDRAEVPVSDAAAADETLVPV